MKRAEPCSIESMSKQIVWLLLSKTKNAHVSASLIDSLKKIRTDDEQQLVNSY